MRVVLAAQCVKAIFAATQGCGAGGSEDGAAASGAAADAPQLETATARRPPRTMGYKGEHRRWALAFKAQGQWQPCLSGSGGGGALVLIFRVKTSNRFAVEQNTKGMTLLEMGQFLRVERLDAIEAEVGQSRRQHCLQRRAPLRRWTATRATATCRTPWAQRMRCAGILYLRRGSLPRMGVSGFAGSGV